MDWVMGIIRWIFFESIFGVIIVAAIASILASGFVAMFRLKKSGPTIVASSVLFAGAAMMFFALGEDRYRFERETQAQIDQSPWVRVITTARWGDILAPRTWFDAPKGFFRVAQPDLRSGWSDEEPVLLVTLLRYDEAPSVGIAHVYCAEREAYWSYPDSKGTFRYEAGGAKKVTDREYEVFCGSNWRPEIDKMFEAANAQ